MAQTTPLAIDTVDAATATTLKAVKAKLGMVPSLFAMLAHAPAALSGYLGLSETLGTGRLSASRREIVALAAARANCYQYCLSAHVLISKDAGLSAEAIAAARTSQATNAPDNTTTGFARALVEQRGVVSADAMTSYRRAGLDDGLILEVIANAALNTLTNYTNHIADPTVGFPVAAVRSPQAYKESTVKITLTGALLASALILPLAVTAGD